MRHRLARGLGPAVAAAALAACGGGTSVVCEPDPSYAGRQDGRELAVPEGLSEPPATGRFAIPPIREAAREADPRCTAYPPRIAGVESAEERSRREQREAAARRRQQEQEAAMAAAAGSSPSARVAPEPPSTAGEPVASDTRLYAEVYDLVASWSQAWAEQRLAAYLSAYASAFRPPRPMTRDQWEEVRARRMQEGAQAAVQLDSLEVYQGADGPVARFREEFEFEGIESDIIKELLLVREGGSWRILAERVIDVR